MITFALITEGGTDSLVLKPLLNNYFFGSDIFITQGQPLVDATDRQVSPGGWREVISYCGNSKLEDILVENDYLIIQIDSDVSEERGFDVSWQKKDDGQVDFEMLHQKIVEKLIGLLPESVRETSMDKIIFAIGMHSIECWLLPCINPDSQDCYNSCLDKLNKELKSKRLFIIPKNRKNDFRAKSSISKLTESFSNREKIRQLASKNIGFQKFISYLDSVLNLQKHH